MIRETILFIDKDVDFLWVRKDCLQQAGYRVLTATNLQEARHILSTEHINLIISGVRLEDDCDETDVSGLMFARQINLSIPKIILTQFSTVKDIRWALRQGVRSLLTTTGFISKEEGIEALLEAVQVALRPVLIVSRRNRNNSTLREIEKLIEEQHLRPTIVYAQTMSDRSLIEQSEDYPAVRFVVVLLTSADIAEFRRELRIGRIQSEQSIVFDLAYLAHKFGAEKIAVLYQGDVDRFFEADGMAYLSLDSKLWKDRLAQAMKASGLNRSDQKQVHLDDRNNEL